MEHQSYVILHKSNGEETNSSYYRSFEEYHEQQHQKQFLLLQTINDGVEIKERKERNQSIINVHCTLLVFF